MNGRDPSADAERLAALKELPRDDGEPIFKEPWEAQAFALAVQLSPRYVRGKSGAVERDHGVFVFRDTNAMGQGEKPQHVYSVRFTARELWADQANPKDTVVVNLWDDYLDAI